MSMPIRISIRRTRALFVGMVALVLATGILLPAVQGSSPAGATASPVPSWNVLSGVSATAVARDGMGDLFVGLADGSVDVIASQDRTLFGQAFAAGTPTPLAAWANQPQVTALAVDGQDNLVALEQGVQDPVLLASATVANDPAYPTFLRNTTANQIKTLTAFDSYGPYSGLVINADGDYLFDTNDGGLVLGVVWDDAGSMYGSPRSQGDITQLIAPGVTPGVAAGMAVQGNSVFIANPNNGHITVVADGTQEFFGQSFSNLDPAELSSFILPTISAVGFDGFGDLYGLGDGVGGAGEIKALAVTYGMTAFGQSLDTGTAADLNGLPSFGGPTSLLLDPWGNLVVTSTAGVIVTANQVGRQCPPGTYLSGGFCTPAPLGSAVPLGASSPVQCAPGTYSSALGATSCSPAPRGSYATGPGAVASTLCPAGTYAPMAAMVSCLNVAAGMYSSEMGALSPASFLLCPAGEYCPAGSSTPTPCPAGTYCPRGTVTPVTCPAGSSCSVSSNAPVPCPAGTYCVAASAAPTNCPAGTYSQNSGQSVCAIVPIGSYLTGTGSSAVFAPCPAGSSCRGGAWQPVECAPGQACLAGSSEPAMCASGYYQPEPNQSTCLLASQGSYAPAPGPHDVAGATHSVLCAKGTYAATPGQSECTLAQPGFFVAITGGGAPTPCGTGFMQLLEGQAACVARPTATTLSLKKGSSSVAHTLTLTGTNLKGATSVQFVDIATSGAVSTITKTVLTKAATKITFATPTGSAFAHHTFAIVVVVAQGQGSTTATASIRFKFTS